MSTPCPVLELRTVRGSGGGPEKTILLGTARIDASRFPTVVCYLRDARDRLFEIDRRAAGARVEYVEVIERHSFDVRIWPALRRLVRDRGIRIVHSHDYKTDLLAWLLAMSDRIVPLATVHGWTGQTWRERVGYYPLDRRVLTRFPRLIAVSEDIRRTLIQSGARAERVVTVLNGIDHRAFKRDRSREQAVRSSLGLSQNETVIGAVGRLERQKRFDLLIEAFAELRRTNAALRLLIVGEGSLRDELTRQVRGLGLGDACRFLGLRSDVIELHHAFDLFVQSSEYEGTPNAVLEAMALETPVVATDVGGTAEIARAEVDAVIVPPRDVHALGAAIGRVIAEPRAARERVVEARRQVEGPLSFERRMSTLEDIYAQLTARHG